MAEDDRSLEFDHVGKAEDRRRAEALARMNARVDALEQQDAAAAAPDPGAKGEQPSLSQQITPAPGSGEQWWQTAIRNVSPLEFMGGALDYADNAFGTIRDLSAKGDQFLMGLGIPAITSEGLTTDYNKFKDTKNVGDYIPDIGDPNKPGLARSVGKFLAGYATAGRALSGVQSLRTLAESGRFGQSAVAALKGAMSDFTGLNEMEGNLANLVQEFPALENPVSEFLAAKEEDPALVNKLKTAMVGAGFGMAVDGVMAGLKAVRAGRQVQQVTGEMDQLAAGLINEAETQRGMITEVLGNPDDPRLLIDAGEQAAETAAEGSAKSADSVGGDMAVLGRKKQAKTALDVLLPAIKTQKRMLEKAKTDETRRALSDVLDGLEKQREFWEEFSTPHPAGYVPDATLAAEMAGRLRANGVDINAPEGLLAKIDARTSSANAAGEGAAKAAAPAVADKYRPLEPSDLVDGRIIRDFDNVPNLSSIRASVDDPVVLSGVREVDISDFTLTGKHYSVAGTNRITELADQISQSGEISPLIVVVDKEGPYILEGATRAEALHRIGAKSFPAVVVLDGIDPEDAINNANGASQIVSPAATSSAAESAVKSADNAAAPAFRETRGSEILHGSSSPVNLTEGHYETMNIYGQGFYTTDAADVADGYMKKGKGGNPSQYVVSPRSDAVLYNLDQPMTTDVRSAIEDLAQVDDAVHDALHSSDEPITSLRQVYDEIRAQSRGADRSADEVQGVFESIQARMEDLGFSGYTHKGKGGPKKLSEHTVRIFFNPVRDVKLTPVAPDFFHQKPPAQSVSSAPLENAGGRVGNVFVNWSRIDSEDDVKNVIQELANRHSDSLSEATRGVQSFGDTQAAAATEDAWRLLQERRQGQPLNAEQTLAVRELWTSSGTAVRDLSRKVAAGGSVADQIALKKMIAVHATIQEQVIGIRTETARALSQWRIPAGESDQFLNGMRDLMDKMGTSRDVMQIAQSINQLSAMGRVDAADAFINGASKIDDLKRYGQNGADMIRQLFYTSLLSGPKTHVRNAVSNTGMLIANAVDRKGASILGEVLGGPNVPDGETGSLLYGTWQGILDAFRISDYARAMAEAEGRTPHSPIVNALLTGQQGMGIGKLEQPAVGAFDAEKLGFARDSSLGRVLDWIDTATNSPMRALAAGDDVFRTANYNAQIHALSFRQAWQEAESGMIERSAIASRAAELAGDPSTAIKMLANDYAEKSIFANRPPSDSKLFKAMKGISQLPVVGKLAMAFTKTPYNIFIESAQRGPMALVTKKFYEEIGAGGARADIAWTKFLMGNAALIALADIAVKGGITGPQRGIGGENAAGELENLRRMGEMPMSVKNTAEDGSVRTFGYRGMEPFSTHLGLASSLVEILSSDQFDADDKEIEDVVVAAIGAMANQITAPSFMSGLSELVNFQSDPTRNAGNYAERIAGTLVPNAVAEVARAQDPTIREVQGMLDAIKAKTPGLSKTLPPNTDRWGKDLTRESGLGVAYDTLSPFASTKTKPEPIDRELAALEYPLAKPQKKQWFDGIPVNMKLHPKEYTRYVKLAGNETTSTVEGDPITVKSIGFESEGGGLRDELNAIVQGNHSFSDIYMDESDDDEPGRSKADYIRLIVNAYREAAKFQLLEEFPALRAKVAMRYENARAQGLVPEGNRFLDME